tara:strand:- start:201 stop:1391 length:1191 start_codon:yes stop_codon:yes gene_type:complete
MGKGGGGGQQPTRTTSVSTSLPEYAEPFYQRLMQRTEAESNRPYEPYGGQRFAQFSPEQEESFGIASEIGRQGVPQALRLGTLRAADAATYDQTYDAQQVRSDLAGDSQYDAGQVRRDLAAGSQYTPGTFETGRFIDPNVAAQYMNPFVENVIGAQRRREQQRFDETVPQGIRAQAAQRGAFGGSRGALQEQLAQERLNERLLDQDSQLRATAFQQAQGAFMSDEQRAQRGQQLADASGQVAAKLGITRAELADRSAQQAAKLGITRAELADRAAQAEGRLGLAGEELGLKAAGELARYGGLEQQYGLRAADVLRQVGEQRQAQEQQLLDIGYSDFLSERDFPRQNLGYLSGIMHGVPVSPSSETSVYQRPPSGGQQLLGYGLGGLGLARSVFGQG